MPSSHHDQPQKKERACDACRRRKTKCDGPLMPNHVCTNCLQTRKECTYVEASKPRGPPKAYITGLEDRLEALEAMVQKLSPGEDYSLELGPPVVRGSWKSHDAYSRTSTSRPILTTNILPPLLIPYQSQEPSSVEPVPIVFSSSRSTHLPFHTSPRAKHRPQKKEAPVTFTRYRSDDSDDDSSSSSSETDDVTVPSFAGKEKITLRGIEADDATEDNNMRFHGRSSTAGLVEVTRQFKHIHFNGDNKMDATPPAALPTNLVDAHSRRRQFWKRPDWESSYEGHDPSELLRSALRNFPPEDLAHSLINIYFRQSNPIFPLLHRPTFERHWKDKLYLQNIWFADVCLAIFAVASRWCSDERVLPVSTTADEEGNGWRLAGRRYYDVCMEIHRVRRSLFYPTSLFEIQALTLLVMYLRGTCTFPTAWNILSVGLRKAQDVGAHRRRVYRDEPHPDDELWKRAFWSLIVLDRIVSANLGRPCGIAEEDFDIDLPLEVDDENWEPTNGSQESFKQPPGTPSMISAFIQLIKLTQVIAFALKTLYAIDRTIYRGHIKINMRTMKEQSTSAMNDWLESLPPHLKWTDTMDASVFSNQSSFLFLLYYSTQILVYRPLIAKASFTRNLDTLPLHNPDDPPPPIPALTDPALTSCIDAATATARIIQHQKKLGIYNFYVPTVIDVCYICSSLFLLRAWNLKTQDRDLRKSKSMGGIADIKPLVRHIEDDAAYAKTFLDTLEMVRERWNVVDVLIGDIQNAFADLVDDSSFHPLPAPTQAAAAPTSVPVPPPAPAPTQAQPPPAPTTIIIPTVASHQRSFNEPSSAHTSPSDQPTPAYTIDSPSVPSSARSSFSTSLGRHYPFTPSPSLYPSPIVDVRAHPIRFPSSRRPSQAVGLGRVPNIAQTGLWAPALQSISSTQSVSASTAVPAIATSRTATKGSSELPNPPTVPSTPLSAYPPTPLSSYAQSPLTIAIGTGGPTAPSEWMGTDSRSPVYNTNVSSFRRSSGVSAAGRHHGGGGGGGDRTSDAGVRAPAVAAAAPPPDNSRGAYGVSPTEGRAPHYDYGDGGSHRQAAALVPGQGLGHGHGHEHGHHDTHTPFDRRPHPHQHSLEHQNQYQQHGYPSSSQVQQQQQQQHYYPSPSIPPNNVPAHGLNPENIVASKNPRLDGWGSTLDATTRAPPLPAHPARPDESVWHNAHYGQQQHQQQQYMARMSDAIPHQETNPQNVAYNYAQTM